MFCHIFLSLPQEIRMGNGYSKCGRIYVQVLSNRDYFSGPAHVERVRQWRKANPGDWRHKASRVPDALQESLTPQEPRAQQLDDGFGQEALQDTFFMQPTILVGLIAHL